MNLSHLRGEYVSNHSLTDMKEIWIYYFLWFNSDKFMSDYLYFPNHLKDIKDRI